MDNLYDILGVSQSATKEEIRKSYRQLAAKYHPDRNSDASAPEQFRKITMEGSKTEPKGSQMTTKMEPKGCQMATRIAH